MDSILQFDHSVIFYVHEHLVYSFLTPIMAILSKITSNGALWILIALLLMIQKKYRVLGVAIIIALGFVFIIGDQGLKPNVARLSQLYQKRQVFHSHQAIVLVLLHLP